jgi:hypothetical protein
MPLAKEDNREAAGEKMKINTEHAREPHNPFSRCAGRKP